MALAASPLSQVLKGLRAWLDGELNDPGLSKVNVLLATPADTASAGAGDSEHRLNLFFYRFEPSGLFPDSLPGETGWVRAFCLITPFAAEEGSISAGENDLRLIGEVMRVFQEQPVFQLTVDDEDYHLQVLFQPLGLDQLNQLWSTQGDTIYRPSVLYEVSLAPIVPAVKTVPAPLAGGLSLGVGDSLEMPAENPADQAPEVEKMTPDLSAEGWAPALAFVHQGACGLSYSFALGGDALDDFEPRVWIAGKAGATVRLQWETWDATDGWQKQGAATDHVIASTGIDPDQAAAAPLVALTLPFTDHVGQMLLYAERQYPRAGDGVMLTVRSNLLLVSLYAE